MSAISDGSQFPKGRLDSMLSHLLRRCPRVTQSDRENVFLYLQASPGGPVKRKQSNGGFEGLPASKLHTVQLPDNHVSQPDPRVQFGQLQQQSALETLAEVSRRHLDFSSQRRQVVDGQDAIEEDHGRALAEQALMLQLQQATCGPSHPPAIAADITVPFLQSTSEPTSAAKPEFAHHSIDPQLGVITSPMLPQLSESVHGPAYQTNMEDVMMWNPTNSTGRQSFGTAPAHPETPPPGFGLLKKNARRAARGRFSDTRRKEVQEIRKRGACIRCRMLKKPCSEGTPCNTCASVESARLWKGKCLRTRLAEEFTLWSTGLIHTTATIEFPAALSNTQQTSLPGCIEARLFTESNLTICFFAKQNAVAIGTPDELDPCLTNDSGPGDECLLLLDASENFGDKIEEYFNGIASMRATSEPSKFMQATIRKAVDLIFEQQAEQTRTPSQHVSRSCYNLQRQLLNNVIELWLETSVLMAPEQFQPYLRYNPNKAPQKGLYNTKWDAEDMSTFRSIGNTSRSYGPIKIQLLTAMELRCSKLAKTVINELERRLLQRQQVSRFSTFIAAVILLNCVERITALYHALDSGTMTPEVIHGFRLSDWPLDETPDALWPQGEHFASLLITLLRMRALPPITCENSDGTLSVVQDYSMPVHVNSKPVRDQVDEQVVAAADWLNPLQLKVAELRAKRDCDLTENGNRADAWDMRLISQVLLPE